MAVKPTSRPRQLRSLETEKRLRQAALELLSEGGLEACSAPALAARAEVAVGTIYARYEDKDALIADALLEMATLGGGALDASFRDWARQTKSLEAFLRRVAETATAVTCEQRTFLLAVRTFSGRYPDQDWRERFRSAQGRARAQILAGAAERFGATIAGGEPSLRLALQIGYAAIEATWLEPSPAESPAVAEFVDALVAMQVAYLRGL